ncbi:NAD-dependent epimerase/dehydratase [Rhodopirellula baltica SH28]|uniref:dTDP-4-dehydrorhamnose reductase n=1 Tax=Rhodopirellula baltica SH28 TaxID=993517 RepID=K5C9L2_RHOBT|nr:sugar nucleotide-binding protein [Rhodopirellula baltica]EKJ99829.1 NAD-dependent epimerase/dehydratase [Rhodopirellula baltica SH28]
MIIVLGGSGYVGKAITKSLSKHDLEYATLSRSQLDYSDSEKLSHHLISFGARFLINAAGYTGKPNVDACEHDKSNCLFGNAILPGRIADACRNAGIPWGHISSGCIYTGSKGASGFTEEDLPNFSFRQDNCSFYSGTKALGEEILANEKSNYIWRLRIPFDQFDGPRNYLSKLMRYERLLEATNSVSELSEFADACVQCYLKNLPFGIYNITNPDEVSTHEVIDLITSVLPSSKQYQFFASEEDFMSKTAIAPRSNCVLDSSKILKAGIKLTPARDAIARALNSWVPEKKGKSLAC